MGKELEKKIISCLEKIGKRYSSQKINDKKINFLLSSEKEYKKIEQSQEEYQELTAEVDQTEKNILLAEIQGLEEQKKQLIEKIKEEIIKEEGTKQSVLMEIRPGTGGTEAGLFARDLYRMYYKFAEKKSWQVEMTETNVDKEGNFNFVSFLVKGRNAFRWLKNEAGVHRVQRIPQTESKGRIHTSTATVAVLPEAQDIVLNIQLRDLEVETYNSGGPGGQHANKTASAVRITHLPTKIVATSQDSRDQRVNRERALFVLKSRLLEKLQTEQQKKTGNLRSAMIGTAERAEKIRTYNYPQNRITDHRLGISWNKLNFIIEGDLEEVCQKLIDYEVEKKLLDYSEK